MPDKAQPGRAIGSCRGSMVFREHPADDVFVDVDAKGVRNLLCDAGTANAGVAAFDLEDRVDQRLRRSLRAGALMTSRREEPPIFAFLERLVEPEEGSGLQDDGELRTPSRRRSCARTAAARPTERLLMEWSGRAPAPPASEAGKGRQRQGARHASETQSRDRRGPQPNLLVRRKYFWAPRKILYSSDATKVPPNASALFPSGFTDVHPTVTAIGNETKVFEVHLIFRVATTSVGPRPFMAGWSTSPTRAQRSVSTVSTQATGKSLRIRAGILERVGDFGIDDSRSN
jgi:hypothetical protein